MNLFHIDSSLRQEGAVSRQLGQTLREAWQAGHPQGTVTYRDLGVRPVPHLSHEEFLAAMVPDAERTPAQRAALALSGELASELKQADAFLFASPIYNWGVPSTLKAWVDHVMLDRSLSQGQVLAGRPAVLVMAKGGAYGPGTPKEGWDYAEPWLRRIFADVMGLDLQVVAAELTLAGVNPAMAHLQEVADASLANALTGAAQAGRRLAAQRADAAA